MYEVTFHTNKMKGMFDLLLDDTFHCKWHFTRSESQNKDLFTYKLFEINSLESNFCFKMTE